MKLYKKSFGFIVATAAMFSLTGCLEETFPEDDYATEKQIQSSPLAISALINGIPSQMAQGYLVYERQEHETDMAYPQFMIAQTELLGDMYPGGSNSGYDWYRTYNTLSASCGATSYFSYLPWFTLYKFIKTDNDIINNIDGTDEGLSADLRAYLGMAYAARAFNYYMLTVFFQPMKNHYTNVTDELANLTAPKVVETTTPEEAKNNPRLTKAQMKEFILSDLDKAEKNLAGYKVSSNLFPSLAVVYGIKAKTYLWFEDYENAALYARKAIDESGATPVTAKQWEDPNAGFCVANQAWMWYLHYDAENMGNLCNFTGWMSGEADWGYSSLTLPMIDKSLYDKMGENDFRRTTFLHPDKYDYYQYKSCRDEDFINNAPAYLSLKFRCKDGNYKKYQDGGSVDCPIMRVEEMMLIEAEAVGMSKGVEEGKKLLVDFVKNYRDPGYKCKASTTRELQLAVLDQMRIEFWGEGNAFPSAKRIQPDIVQNYEGTNAPANIYKINCKGIKPNWNFVIPQYETQSNQILEKTNNPDPTKAVVGPINVGEWANEKY